MLQLIVSIVILIVLMVVEQVVVMDVAVLVIQIAKVIQASIIQVEIVLLVNIIVQVVKENVVELVLIQQFPQSGKAPVGRILAVAQPLCRRMAYHNVHALGPPQMKPQFADPASHFLLGILVGAGMVLPASAQPQDPHTIIDQ